jgi:hypothetical protein
VLRRLARAKMRLAAEYDAAQKRSEVQSRGGDKSKLGDDKLAPTVAEIGLRRDEVHEAQKPSYDDKAGPAAHLRSSHHDVGTFVVTVSGAPDRKPKTRGIKC